MGEITRPMETEPTEQEPREPQPIEAPPAVPYTNEQVVDLAGGLATSGFDYLTGMAEMARLKGGDLELRERLSYMLLHRHFEKDKKLYDLAREYATLPGSATGPFASLLAENKEFIHQLHMVRERDRPKFKAMVAAEVMQKHAGTKRGVVSKSWTAFMRGASGVSENMRSFEATIIGSIPKTYRAKKRKRQVSFLDDLRAITESADPITSESLIARGHYNALGMAVPMAAGGSLPGVAGTIFWATQIAPQKRREYIQEGIPEETATVAGLVAGIGEGMIEQWGRLTPGPNMTSGLRAAGLRFVTRVGKEWAEEPIQEAFGELVGTMAKLVHDQDPSLSESARKVFEAAKESLVPVILLGVPGGAMELSHEALQAARAKPPEGQPPEALAAAAETIVGPPEGPPTGAEAGVIAAAETIVEPEEGLPKGAEAAGMAAERPPAPEMVSPPRTAEEVGAQAEAAGTFRAPEAGVTAIGMEPAAEPVTPPAPPVEAPPVTPEAAPATQPEPEVAEAEALPDIPAEPTAYDVHTMMGELAKIAERWGTEGKATQAEVDWVFRAQKVAEPGSDLEGGALSMMKSQPPIAPEVEERAEAAPALPPVAADRINDPVYRADVQAALQIEEASPEHEAFVREVVQAFENEPLGQQARDVLKRQYGVGAVEEFMKREPRKRPPGAIRQVVPSARPSTEPPLTPQDVEKVFRGSRVTQQTASQWRVQLPNGAAFDVQMGREVTFDRESLRRDYGDAVADNPAVRVAGGWEFRMANEREGLSGLGVMKLAAGIADTSTLRHEAVHIARSAGLFTDAEWSNLVERFAKDVTESQQEERVANALEQWQTQEPGIWEKIVDFFRRIAGAVGGQTANDAIRAMQTGAIWRRTVPASGTSTMKAQVVYGRPDLANPAIEQEARALVDAVDEARKLKGLPGVQHDIDTQKEAQRRMDIDLMTERANILNRGLQGVPLDDVETMIAKELVNRESTDAIRSRNRDRIRDAIGFNEAYRRTGTEAARALRLRADPLESPEQRTQRMLLESLLTPRKDLALRLRKAIDAGDQAEAQSVQAEWATEIESIRQELLAMGYDIDRMDSIAGDPVAAANMVRAISTAKADGWDAAYEFWISSILSAPTTQAANIIGNTVFATWDMLGQRAVESLVNMGVELVGRKPTGATWGEFRYVFAGFASGMAQGARNFVRTFQTEMPWFEYEMGRERAGKLEGRGPKIKGKKGRIIRIPLRLLSAFDAWAKTTIARMEVGAQAYRLARQENLSGEQMGQRIADLMADLKSPAWDAAVSTAQRLTFQEKSERLRKVMEVRTKLPGVRYIMPFVMTPARIFQAGVRLSPVGLVKLGERTIHGVRTGDWQGITKRVAEQAVGVAVMLALLNNDEDDPWITGAAKERKRGARLMARRTFPTQSIKIGGTWLSYSRIEPFATAISIAVDGMNAVKTGDPGKVVGDSVDNLLGQVKDKTFMRGISDLMRAAESQNTVEGVGKWAASFATSWVPNIVRSGLRSGKEHYPERGLWGRGGERAKRLLKRTWQRTELPAFAPEPSYDVWGRPARRHGGPLPGTDWLWRMTVPMRIQREDIFVGDRALLNWNNEHPEDTYEPVPPNRYMRVRGEAVYFTDEEYADYGRLAGQRARSLVAGLRLDPANVRASDVKRISSALIDGRAWARSRLKRKYRRLRGD